MDFACRTLLDLRSRADQYLGQALLLAVSWHRFAARDSTLEVRTIGRVPRALCTLFAELDVLHAPASPGPNDGFSKSSNKIEAAFPDASGRRVLLLDNDTCFLGGLSGLQKLPAKAIIAAEAGNMRISSQQWMSIQNDLGIRVLHRAYVPINSRGAATGAAHATECMPLYLNSGVVLFPAGYDHREAWWCAQRRISEFFMGHRLSSDAVTRSDQAGFAASIAEYGVFEWLPLRFNYRHGCFRLGLETDESISILHLTGESQIAGEPTLSSRIDAYWKGFVFPRIDGLAGSVPEAEMRRRREIASRVLDRIHGLVSDYRLDAVFKDCCREGARA